jgi:hypothetical protein
MVRMTFILNGEYMFDFFQLLHDPNMLCVKTKIVGAICI